MNELQSWSQLSVERSPVAMTATFRVPALITHELTVEVGQQLFDMQERNRDLHVIVCCLGLQALSSSMLGKLITLHRRTQRTNRQLVLCDLEPAVEEMFTSSRLSDYFTIVRDRTAAFRLLAGWKPPQASEAAS